MILEGIGCKFKLNRSVRRLVRVSVDVLNGAVVGLRLCMSVSTGQFES